MEVLLTDDLFEPVATMHLLAIWWLGYANVHMITVDSSSPKFQAWLAVQGVEVRDHIALVLSESAHQLSELDYAPRRVCVVQNSRESSYERCEMILRLDEAVNVLNQPLELLVENEINDGNFIRFLSAISSENDKWFKKFDESLVLNRIRFRHGGGSSLLNVLKTLSVIRQLRVWVMCDRDSQSSKKIGKISSEIRDYCNKKNITCNVLNYRTIENYASHSMIGNFINHNPKLREAKKIYKSLLNKIKKLSDEEKHFLPMKGSILESDLAHEKFTTKQLSAWGDRGFGSGLAPYCFSQPYLNDHYDEIMQKTSPLIKEEAKKIIKSIFEEM